MSADSPDPLSPRTRADIDAAVKHVIRMAYPELDEHVWPTGLLQAGLTRDGDHRVISYLSEITAKTVLAVSERSGQSPAAVISTCKAAMRPESLPFSPDSWTSAQNLTLHRLGKPLQIHGGPIEAVDLAGALVLLHVLGTLLFHKAETDARQTRQAPIPRRPRTQHRAAKRRKRPRKR